MIGTVFLEGFATQCRIGCTGKERQFAQAILIDIRCEVDFGAALVSDDRKDCVDYCSLHSIAERAAAGERTYRLLESLAMDIARQVLRIAHVKTVDVTLRKPYKLPGAAAVGISLRLTREEV